jgi:hypothetical protein
MTNELFDEKVLTEINRQSRHGARFPCPVDLMYYGKLTDAAKRLELDSCDDRPVMESVKRLHSSGRVKFVFRYGYTWVVPNGFPGVKPEELIDNPTDAPYYWGNL